MQMTPKAPWPEVRRRGSVLAGLTLAGLTLLAGCGDEGALHGNGRIKTELRALAPFSTIRLEGPPAKLSFWCRQWLVLSLEPAGTKGTAPVQIEVKADDNLLPLVQTAVEGAALQVRLARPVSAGTRVQIKVPVAADLSDVPHVVTTGCVQQAMRVDGR